MFSFSSIALATGLLSQNGSPVGKFGVPPAEFTIVNTVGGSFTALVWLLAAGVAVLVAVFELHALRTVIHKAAATIELTIFEFVFITSDTPFLLL
ncbi:hypothetical protein D3C85_1712390 [compost metagenome]